MNFDLTQDQQMLVDTATSFVKKQSPPSRLRAMREDPVGWSRDMWKHMGELGWLGILYPESVGGFGGSFVDVALLLEQFGTTLVPEPFIPSVVLAGMTIVAAGNADQQARWIAPLIEGASSLALAYAEPQSRFDLARVSTRADKNELAGRGVGLGVVRGTLGKLGGSIEVDSEVGLGARFRIRIPGQ